MDESPWFDSMSFSDHANSCVPCSLKCISVLTNICTTGWWMSSFKSPKNKGNLDNRDIVNAFRFFYKQTWQQRYGFLPLRVLVCLIFDLLLPLLCIHRTFKIIFNELGNLNISFLMSCFGAISRLNMSIMFQFRELPYIFFIFLFLSILTRWFWVEKLH